MINTDSFIFLEWYVVTTDLSLGSKLEVLSLFSNALYFELINSDLASRKPPFAEGTESKREWKFPVG